jgi:hypothetical protein
VEIDLNAMFGGYLRVFIARIDWKHDAADRGEREKDAGDKGTQNFAYSHKSIHGDLPFGWIENIGYPISGALASGSSSRSVHDRPPQSKKLSQVLTRFIFFDRRT